jgi:hypothetical protein
MSGATKGDRSKLGGRVARALARDLALTKLSQTALAEKYGVTQSSISEFKARRAEEIAAIAADADDQYAGIWIAQKEARLAELARLHDIALTPTPKVAPSGKIIREWVTDPETGVDTEVIVSEVDGRLAAQVMKQAAEEMGQLPTRLQVSGDMSIKTNYTVEGVDPKDLR